MHPTLFAISVCFFILTEIFILYLINRKELKDTKVWDNPIVTQVVQFKKFYKAENYHDQYFSRNPSAGYCRVVIAPKIAKLRKKYREKLKK